MSAAPEAVSSKPPTGYRDEDGRLKELDMNDPATVDWLRAKQARFEYDRAMDASRKRANARRKKRRA